MSAVNGVNGSGYQGYTPKTNPKSDAKDTKTNNKTDEKAAVYEKSEPAVSAKKTYTRDDATINALKADAERQTQVLRDMVRTLLAKQGITFKNAYESVVEIDAATREEASKMIAEDGPMGVKAVSENILNFAKALCGGDPSKIDTLRKAFEDGFAAAEKAWGGKLPDICYQTYDAVQKGFDDWAAEGKGEAE